MYRKALTSDSLSGRMVFFGQKLPIIPSRLGRRLGLSPPHTERVVRRRAAQSSAASARSAALAFGATAAACGLSGVGPTGVNRSPPHQRRRGPSLPSTGTRAVLAHSRVVLRSGRPKKTHFIFLFFAARSPLCNEKGFLP